MIKYVSYEGNSIDEMLELLKNESASFVKPLSEDKIQIMLDFLGVDKLPKQFMNFLRQSGGHFEPWSGFSYKLIDKNNRYIDMSEEIKEDEDIEDIFKQWGFKYEECLFFVNNQGIVYYFIRIDDKDDDPLVYSVTECIDTLPEPFRFSELIIDSYNEMVGYRKQMYMPFSILREERYERYYKSIKEKNELMNKEIFDFKDKRYVKFNIKKYSKDNCFRFINPFLKKLVSFSKIHSVEIYYGKDLFYYIPDNDIELENEYNINVYEDNAMILSRDIDYEWVWYAKNGAVYAYGDLLIKCIKENPDELFLEESDAVK